MPEASLPAEMIDIFFIGFLKFLLRYFIAIILFLLKNQTIPHFTKYA